MANDITKKLSNIEVSINRLRSQKAALAHKLKKQDNKQRKIRTRTLIQLGGLLEITPLPAICDIALGDDLQVDHPNKAAGLLGILSYFCEQLPENISEENLAHFQSVGVKLVKSSDT